MSITRVSPNIFKGIKMHNNKSYLIALNRLKGFTPRMFPKLIAKWPNLAEMFSLSARDLEKNAVPAKLAEAISRFDLQEVTADLEWQAAALTHKIITIDEPAYPDLLKQIADPPIVLYTIGDISGFKKPSVAIVGSRKPSIIGLENSYRFAFELAQEQITVVSGLALGVDARAHQGTIAAGGQTIAVLGTGVDNIYPRRHLALAERICENGAIISEFSLKTPPIAGHFPRRNRIISGLALATLVVEAAIRSGSLITARLALDQNRDVLAIPGSIHNQQARGCHQLLQQGAKLVTSCVDILDELNISASSDISHDLTEPEFEQGLARYIGFEVTSVDQLIARSGWSISDIMCSLAKLELKGIVNAVPGGYMRCR